MLRRFVVFLPALLLPLALLLGSEALAAVPGPAPDAIIKAMYDRYQADPDTVDDNSGEPPFFTPELEALYVSANQDRGDEMPIIDWDVFVNGQDSKITRVRLTKATKADGTVVVTARFDNFGTHQTVVYDFVGLPEGWRCSDLHYPKSADFPDGFSLKTWIVEGMAETPPAETPPTATP